MFINIKKNISKKYKTINKVHELLKKRKYPIDMVLVNQWLKYGEIDHTMRTTTTVGYVMKPIWFYLERMSVDIIKNIIRFMI